MLKKNKNFEFLKLDLKNFSKLSQKIKKYKIDKVIHLAAQPGVRISVANPHNTLSQNLISFSNIIELSRLKNVKKFIYASSSSVYGETKIYPFNEKDYKNIPTSVYGATKFSNEIIAQAYAKNFKMKCIGLRFFTVYGPFGRPDMAYYSFLENLRKNKKIVVFNKGVMKRDFTFIDDVVKAIIAITKVRIKKDYAVINIGKGKPDNLMDLVNLIQKNYNKKFKISYTKNIPIGDIKKTFSNTRKAKNLIKWNPKITLEEGIKKFVDWYRLNHGTK
ncbi:NAD-dependent epimerase/dehydratase family protein [Candidatus Pelagibacter bacterium nBUS_30]|uniref:NAD-dependent epimerase/dehydratase family protein n=1 Tax=Candidatus Pelagibacter bacterium nBUS_30 TaxID=3374191 RepID=UPI003EBC96B8